MAKHFGGSMGSHKHGTSGHPHRTGRHKMAVNRAVEALRATRKSAKMHGSIRELMREKRDA